MTSNEFQTLLQKGLGRAILFLHDNDDAPYRDLIVYACTHNMAFDRQTESRCADYYFDLISAAKNPLYYRDRLLASLIAPLEDEYPYQIFEIAGLFAASGDEGAKAAMYAAFAEADSDDMGRADLLIRLDGYTALEFITQHRPMLDAEEDDYLLDECIEILEKRYGEAEAWHELERMAAENPVIVSWLAIVRQARERYRKTRRNLRKKKPHLSYGELKQRIATQGRKYISGAGLWYRHATESERVQAAQDLLLQTDPDLLAGTLRLFRSDGFPLDPARVIALTASEDAEIAHWAFLTLEHTTHPKVRDFALECLANSQHLDYVVGLLNANFEPCDSAIVAKLTEQSCEADKYHRLEINAKHFVEAHWDEYSVPILRNLYENGPCALCRNGCVEMMIERDTLPDEIRAEARYDGYEDTRTRIRNAAE